MIDVYSVLGGLWLTVGMLLILVFEARVAGPDTSTVVRWMVYVCFLIAWPLAVAYALLFYNE